MTMPVAEPCVHELVEVSCTIILHQLTMFWQHAGVDMIHQPANDTRQVTRSTRSALMAVSNASAAAAEVN